MQQILAIGWFPEPEWAEALVRWPVLAEEMPADHTAYRAAIEARMADIQARTRGARLMMVSHSISDLDELAEADSMDAGSAELRGRAASLLAQHGAGVAWPPNRNEHCWCRSSVKYKHCCGALRSQRTANQPA